MRRKERTALVVDRDRCIGSGLCEVIAPGYFAVDPDEGAVRLVATPREVDADVAAAVDRCPSGALRLSSDS
ncbi:MAG: ferredoxin [Mycobacteriales bacterium]